MLDFTFLRWPGGHCLSSSSLPASTWLTPILTPQSFQHHHPDPGDVLSLYLFCNHFSHLILEHFKNPRTNLLHTTPVGGWG